MKNLTFAHSIILLNSVFLLFLGSLFIPSSDINFRIRYLFLIHPILISVLSLFIYKTNTKKNIVIGGFLNSGLLVILFLFISQIKNPFGAILLSIIYFLVYFISSNVILGIIRLPRLFKRLRKMVKAFILYRREIAKLVVIILSLTIGQILLIELLKSISQEQSYLSSIPTILYFISLIFLGYRVRKDMKKGASEVVFFGGLIEYIFGSLLIFIVADVAKISYLNTYSYMQLLQKIDPKFHILYLVSIHIFSYLLLQLLPLWLGVKIGSRFAGKDKKLRVS